VVKIYLLIEFIYVFFESVMTVSPQYHGFADIGWNNLFATEERKKLFDMTEPYNLDEGSFLVCSL
jgi:hypothetical protein